MSELKPCMNKPCICYDEGCLRNCSDNRLYHEDRITTCIKYITEIEDDYLKPCPFCGEKPEIKEVLDCDDLVFDIACYTKDCYLEYGADWNLPKEIILPKWNTRPGINK